MSDKETKRDLSRTLKTGTIGVSHVLEKSGNKVDQLAKTMSKSRMEQQYEQQPDNTHDAPSQQSDSSYGVHTQSTEYVQYDTNYQSMQDYVGVQTSDVDREIVRNDDLIKTTAYEQSEMSSSPLQAGVNNETSFDSGASVRAENMEHSGIKTAVYSDETQHGSSAMLHNQETSREDVDSDDLIKTNASDDELSITPLHEQTDAELSFDTGATIKTEINENSGIKTAINSDETLGGRTATLESEGVSESVIKTAMNPDFADDAVEEIEGSAEGETSHIKTGVKKALHTLNKKTFDFQAEQGKFSKAVTIAGKTGKAIGKTGKTIVRASDTLRRAVDNEDTTGSEFIKGSAVRLTRRTAGKQMSKLAGKGASRLARVIITLLKSAVKYLAGLLGTLSSFAGVLVAIMGAVALLMLVFGMSGSQSTVQKYEEYMVAVQESYDREVDRWIANNPDGIVIGVRGDYGRIDWRVPLSIIQGTGAKMEYDYNEWFLLETFKNAGLLEKHTETEQEITVVEDDEEVIKKIKVLTITNAGYDEYMRWCNSNFVNIATFMWFKEVYSNEQTFTSEQMEIIESLNSSDSFFDMFSDTFKEHATTTGSNASEQNFNSPEYNNLNIFTQAGYKGQCTWYAYGRALKLTGKKMPSGDAQTWLNSAIAMGYPTGTRPSKNAVVVLSGGSFGHVAFVEAWDGTSITVSEGNYNNPYANTNMMVEYARNHAVELVHEQKYPDYNAYRETQARNGLTIVGFIYLE